MALSPVHGAPAPQRTNPEQAAGTLSGGDAGALAAGAGTGTEALAGKSGADLPAEAGRGLRRSTADTMRDQAKDIENRYKS